MSLENGTFFDCLLLCTVPTIFHSKTSSINFLIFKLQEAGRALGLESCGGLLTSLVKVVFPTISFCAIPLLMFLHLFAYNSSGVGMCGCNLGKAIGGCDECCYRGTEVCLGEAPIKIPSAAGGPGTWAPLRVGKSAYNSSNKCFSALDFSSSLFLKSSYLCSKF